MNRLEALHILGLGEDAAFEDVKAAYRECAQILHPDKFATNKKLQDRATEQFKILREAYDCLTQEEKSRRRKGSARSSARKTSASDGSTSRSASSASCNYRAEDDFAGSSDVRSDERRIRCEVEARLAGVLAARAQLVAQRDALDDERRNGMVMAALGALVAAFTLRRPYGLFGLVAAVASTACVWGLVQTASASRSIATLNDHLKKLGAEKKKLTADLEEMD